VVSQESLPAGGSALRVFRALAEYVLASGCDPHAFAMDYKRLADLAGYADKKNAWKSVKKAEKAGILFRLHPGKPREPGKVGVPALLCLRGFGESIDEAIEAGKRSPHYKSRISTAALPTLKPFYGSLTWSELQECDPEKHQEFLCLLVSIDSSFKPGQIVKKTFKAQNSKYLNSKVTRSVKERLTPCSLPF
jgi:hypothetical protein